MVTEWKSSARIQLNIVGCFGLGKGVRCRDPVVHRNACIDLTGGQRNNEQADRCSWNFVNPVPRDT